MDLFKRFSRKKHCFDQNKKDAASRPGFPAPLQLRDVYFSFVSILPQDT
jgi:hypothetical protein